MKQLTTFLLALGLSSVCAMSQNVTVYLKDNTSHKYNAEYLSDIKFRDVTPTPDEVQFKTISLDVYSGGNVTLTMENEGGDVKCVADLYGTNTAVFLEEGTYEVKNDFSPFSVSPQYSSVSIDGEVTKPVSGSVVVEAVDVDAPSGLRKSAGDQYEYSITVNFELEGGKSFKGHYAGKLPTYTPWISAELNRAQYNINPQPKGQFYVKFFDADWKYDIAMIFMAEENATRLPAGTYTLNDFATPGSLLSGSYVEGYSPNFNCKLLDGSKVVVEENNGDYTINMYLNLSDGRYAEFNFTGSISGEPLFTDPELKGDEYSACIAQPFGYGNTTIYLYDTADMADYTKMIALDCYGSSNATYFEPGVYTIGGSEAPYIDSNPGYTFYSTNDGSPVGFKSGTLTVKLEGSVYTLILDAVLSDDERTVVQGWYEGAINEFGPTVNMTLSAASYSTNPRPAGNFYVKFNDADWKCEMAIDFFADRNAKTLPAGTYTYSTDNTPGTFGSTSFVDLFNPNSNNRMTEGSSIDVNIDDFGVYSINMNLKFEDGRTATMNYEGSISGTPVFETAGDEYKTCVAEPFGYGNTTIYLYDTADMADYTKMIALDCYGSSNATYFEPGVYTIGGSEAPYIDSNPGYTFYSTNDGTLVGFKSGTLTVKLNGSVYTLELDAVLNDDASTVVQGWYEGSIKEFGPTVNMTLSSASYSTNPRPAGNFYVKFNDADWKCEMAIDFFADQNAETLPAGTYTYSTANTPGTFGSTSFVDLFNPNSNNRMTEGSSIDVNIDDYGVYSINMNLKFEDGRTATMNYEGSISGTPVFE
ncbi:MAG: hypothetical protein HDR84_06230 [Bacteroides sp.]|nr:hypothetical protein [Bacteroides sp.]